MQHHQLGQTILAYVMAHAELDQRQSREEAAPQPAGSTPDGGSRERCMR